VAELASADLGAASPQVVASQVDVLPAERWQVLKQAIIDSTPVSIWRMSCPLQIRRVPPYRR
jgi:hypothetical protein